MSDYVIIFILLTNILQLYGIDIVVTNSYNLKKEIEELKKKSVK